VNRRTRAGKKRKKEEKEDELEVEGSCEQRYNRDDEATSLGQPD
jgi:hypothetical protein